MSPGRPAPTIGELLATQGVSRRAFLKYCAAVASLLALPPSMAPVMAQNLAGARRTSVLWMPFQECTGCAESLTRSFSPSVENLLFNTISLDYQETLMAAAGHQAEAARQQAMEDNWGEYLLLVDGSVPDGAGGAYCMIGGKSALQLLEETAAGALAIVSVGTCAAFGGIPAAAPNPTGGRPIGELVTDKPVINVPGCPPIPAVITATLTHVLALGQLPELDHLNRPLAFFGNSIHDRCYRRPFYDQGKFAHSFDDEGARSGWCLYELGCRGPVTYNACATQKWNEGTSFPIESGHPCLGCSEPDFWDRGGFYQPVTASLLPGGGRIAAGALLGAALGAGAAAAARYKRRAHLHGGQPGEGES